MAIKLTSFLIFICVLFTFEISHAQNFDTAVQKKIDKLEKKIKYISDKEKADIILELSELYWKINPQKGIDYGKQAIAYFQKSKPERVPDALINTAVCFYYLGEVDSTIYYCEQSIDKYEKFLTENRLGVFYNLLCVAKRRKGAYNDAISYGDKAIACFKRTNDTMRLPGTLDNIAMVYKNMGNYQKSLDYSLQSLRAFEKNNNEKEVESTHLNISNLYAALKNYDKTAYHLKQAEKIAIKTADNYSLADIYNNFGALYYEIKPDSAMLFYKKALKFYKKAGVKIGIAVATQNMGETYILFKDFTRGISFLKKSAKLFRELNSEVDLMDVYTVLGNAYIQTDQIELAKKALQKAYTYSKKINNPRLRLKIIKQLRDLNVKNSNYYQAYQYQNSYIQLKDSINSLEVQKKVAELDKKYQTEKKEKQISLLKSKEKVQKIKNQYLMIISGGIILSILLFSYFIFQKRKKEKAIMQLQLQQTYLKQQQLEQEIEYKNKELASHAIHIMQRNKLLQNYCNTLSKISPEVNEKAIPQIKTLKREIKKTLKSKKDWENFKIYFEQTNSHFINELKNRNSQLTQNDYRLASLIKIGMTNKELASIFNISSQSVKNAMYRLKKKIVDDDKMSLRAFLKNL